MKVEELMLRWATWATGMLGSRGYPCYSLDSSHAMGKIEYTVSKRKIEAIRTKIKKKKKLSAFEQDEISYYNLWGEPRTKACGTQTFKGNSVENELIDREAEKVELAMQLLAAKNTMAHSILKDFFLWNKDLSQIAWGFDMVYKKKSNGRVYGDSKWASRKLDQSLEMIESNLNQIDTCNNARKAV